ncbi:MAG: NADPH-dependent 7-cyano-7-deazaguanine reductase QueF [Burkholderiales bacterium]|jgi:7-cyano-7-deazaguanine reductase|nr:NADPH-dependent 7-cyano-7-deazaguanine reductase QueF [Burkholderiales bacterium]
MLEQSQLGKSSEYKSAYDPQLLFPFPREVKRAELGIDDKNPGFYGVDIWTHYEISWLNQVGKPCIAIGEIIYPASTPNIIESKSLKLYFNSFNGTKFASSSEVVETVIRDLSNAVGDKVEFRLLPADNQGSIYKFDGVCLDNLDVYCDTYTPNPDYLTTCNSIVTEELYTNLLKSNCMMTLQPDWASVYIKYTGARIEHAGLLKYIISLRDNNEFHEQCVERIFHDIMIKCKPGSLSVYARYTRRGGLDINPFRTTQKYFTVPENSRLMRQ